jgi:hypothetical protein
MKVLCLNQIKIHTVWRMMASNGESDISGKTESEKIYTIGVLLSI